MCKKKEEKLPRKHYDAFLSILKHAVRMAFLLLLETRKYNSYQKMISKLKKWKISVWKENQFQQDKGNSKQPHEKEKPTCNESKSWMIDRNWVIRSYFLSWMNKASKHVEAPSLTISRIVGMKLKNKESKFNSFLRWLAQAHTEKIQMPVHNCERFQFKGICHLTKGAAKQVMSMNLANVQ